MKRLYVARIGIVIESQKENWHTAWGEKGVFEDAFATIQERYPGEFEIIDIHGVRILREDETNEDAFDSLM